MASQAIGRRSFIVASALVGAGMGLMPFMGGIAPASAAEGKRFTYGTTGYSVDNLDAGLDPHDSYKGWSCLRYGVGETLFHFSDAMEPEPWLATAYEFTDDLHVRVELRDDVVFTSGRAMDAEAVKECIDHLVATHDRAPGDTKICDVTTDGEHAVVIETTEPCPALINYLCDPYGCIYDIAAGVTEDNIVCGTGPYKAVSRTDDQITLVPNADYWNGTPKVDEVVVRSITDGDTLTMALQTGELNATYGLPYASYLLFDNDGYHIESCAGSRVFYGCFNYNNELMNDEVIRTAVCKGIDKQGFVEVLLEGRGAPAVGAFPDSFAFGNGRVTAEDYDPEGAAQMLEDDGWVMGDDGVRQKDGQRLVLRWLTYPSRQEQPLLAEYAQATLGKIGFDVQVNSTSNHTEIRKTDDWDFYVSALVTAPTGDPEYFFTTGVTSTATKNFGHYSNAEVDALAEELHTEFDPERRAELAVQMQQIILDDHAFAFVSHLVMGIVCQSNVTGIAPHPCDYYEITVDLDV